MYRFVLPLLALAAMGSPNADAATAEQVDAVIGGVVFFGGLFGLLIVALVLRLRDARAGLGAEEKQARMKRRLPWIVGAMMGLCLYSVLSF